MTDIKIALYGQIDNDTKFGFTYPDEFNPAMNLPKDAWLKTISDPRDAREFQTAHLYAIWKGPLGNYYAVIVPNRYDTRNGYIMLTLFVGKQVPRNGKVIIDALAHLEQMLINEGITDRQAVAAYLETIKGEFDMDLTIPSDVVKSRIKAFRTYADERELAELFMYPNQAEYESFNRVLIVPRSSVVQVPMNFQELKNVIRHNYIVECPQGVRTNRQTVTDGDILDIVYSKATYADTVVHERVSAIGSQHFSINGSRLIVRSAVEAGVQFVRKAKLDIRSAKSGQPLGEVHINGKRMTNGMEVSLPDVDEIEINVSATGYKELKRKIPVSSLIRTGFILTLQLEPIDENVKVIANCEGTLVDGYVSISVDDKLYRYLRDPHAYEIKITRRQKGTALAVTGNKPVKPKKDNTLLKVLLAALAGLLLGAICILLLTSGNSDTDADEQDSPTNNPAPVVQSNGPSDDQSEAQRLEKQEKEKQEKDIIYLKREDVWYGDSIKSDLYVSFFNSIQEKDIDGMLIHPYSLESYDSMNGRWKRIIEYIQAIKNSQDASLLGECKQEIGRAMKHGNGPFNLSELQTALQTLAGRISSRNSNPSGSSNPRNVSAGGSGRGNADASGSGGGNQGNRSRPNGGNNGNAAGNGGATGSGPQERPTSH